MIPPRVPPKRYGEGGLGKAGRARGRDPRRARDIEGERHAERALAAQARARAERRRRDDDDLDG